MSTPEATVESSVLRWSIAVVSLGFGAVTVVNLSGVAKGTLAGLMFGFWVGGPLLALGAIQVVLARRPAFMRPGMGQASGLICATAAMVLLTIGSQVVVSTDKSSTAAILYVFAPIYTVILGGVFGALGWGGGALIARMARRDPS